jgi:Zn-dependent protease
MDTTNILINVLVYALPVIFAITLHEAAHGYVARLFGDSTAYMLGRVTLNPVKHIDPVGTILLPIVTLAFSPFMFGWAKPVPVNFNNLRRPKADMLWVAAAGPASNLAQLAIWALVAALIGHLIPPTGLAGGFWLAVADAGIKVNIMFALLNLLPVLPLDGGRILTSVLPGRVSHAYQQTERFGLVILLALLFTGVIGWVLNPLYRGMYVNTIKLIGLGG